MDNGGLVKKVLVKSKEEKDLQKSEKVIGAMTFDEIANIETESQSTGTPKKGSRKLKRTNTIRKFQALKQLPTSKNDDDLFNKLKPKIKERYNQLEGWITDNPHIIISIIKANDRWRILPDKNNLRTIVINPTGIPSTSKTKIDIKKLPIKVIEALKNIQLTYTRSLFAEMFIAASATLFNISTAIFWIAAHKTLWTSGELVVLGIECCGIGLVLAFGILALKNSTQKHLNEKLLLAMHTLEGTSRKYEAKKTAINELISKIEGTINKLLEIEGLEDELDKEVLDGKNDFIKLLAILRALKGNPDFILAGDDFEWLNELLTKNENANCLDVEYKTQTKLPRKILGNINWAWNNKVDLILPILSVFGILDAFIGSYWNLISVSNQASSYALSMGMWAPGLAIFLGVVMSLFIGYKVYQMVVEEHLAGKKIDKFIEKNVNKERKYLLLKFVEKVVDGFRDEGLRKKVLDSRVKRVLFEEFKEEEKTDPYVTLGNLIGDATVTANKDNSTVTIKFTESGELESFKEALKEINVNITGLSQMFNRDNNAGDNSNNGEFKITLTKDEYNKVCKDENAFQTLLSSLEYHA